MIGTRSNNASVGAWSISAGNSDTDNGVGCPGNIYWIAAWRSPIGFIERELHPSVREKRDIAAEKLIRGWLSLSSHPMVENNAKSSGSVQRRFFARKEWERKEAMDRN